MEIGFGGSAVRVGARVRVRVYSLDKLNFRRRRSCPLLVDCNRASLSWKARSPQDSEGVVHRFVGSGRRV